MNHVYFRPGKVTVSSGGEGAGLLIAAGVLVAAAVAVAWFLVTYAMVLLAGCAAGVLILAAGVLVLFRWFTVCHWDPDAAARVARRSAAPPQAITQVIHHHHHHYIAPPQPIAQVVHHHHHIAGTAPQAIAPAKQRVVLPGTVEPQQVAR